MGAQSLLERALCGNAAAETCRKLTFFCDDAVREDKVYEWELCRSTAFSRIFVSEIKDA